MPPTTQTCETATVSAPETLAAFQVNSETGLTHAEVATRRKEHGYNEVAEQKGGVVQQVLFSGNTDVAIPPSGMRDLSFSTMEWQQAG